MSCCSDLRMAIITTDLKCIRSRSSAKYSQYPFIYHPNAWRAMQEKVGYQRQLRDQKVLVSCSTVPEGPILDINALTCV